MRSFIFAFVAGVLCVQQSAELLDIEICFFLFFIAVILFSVLFLIGSRHNRKIISIVLNVIGAACLGVFWASIYTHYFLHESLPKEYEEKDIIVVGTVHNLPILSQKGVNFHFYVENAFDGENKINVPKKISLSWYKPREENAAVPQVHAGERWRFSVRLKRPHGNANPYVFDYEAWLLEQGIRATGYVRTNRKVENKKNNERLSDFVLTPRYFVNRLREKIRTDIYENLSDGNYAGVICALVLGDRSRIDKRDFMLFQQTGVSHLIAISGLHVSLIAGLFAWIVFFLWRRSFFTRAKLPLILPAQKAVALVMFVVAFIYALLAGFGVPAQRAFYMLSVVSIALWTARMTGISYVLMLALFVVVLFDPLAVLSAGFWLSFSAVAAILYVSVGRINDSGEKNISAVKNAFLLNIATAAKNMLRVQYAITLALIPLTILLFGQISLISPLANIIAIPFMGFIVTPLALIGSILPSPFSFRLLSLADIGVSCTVYFLEWMNGFSFALWRAPVPPLWLFFVALLGALWMLAPKGMPYRWLGVVCWLPLIFNTSSQVKNGVFDAVFFDVGQGSAVLVETANHRLLYDTGPVYSSNADAANRVLIPYLHGRGISYLDALMLSHKDKDHSGGVDSLAREIKLKSFISSADKEFFNLSEITETSRCYAGQSWVWDDVRFEVLAPESDIYTENGFEENDENKRSCVLKVTAKDGKSLLLTGDIGHAQEKELAEREKNKLKSDVILVPHHGSASSSSKVFLETVNPKFAVFQLGYLNSYKHPDKKVYERYGNLNIKRLRTDENGAIEMNFSDNIEVSSYRSSHTRYWHGK